MSSHVTPEAEPTNIMSGELILPGDGALTASMTRAEIDTQIATAKAYPRSIAQFKRDTKDLACYDEKTAQSMFYSIPRGGKNIVGPSIRLAEICLATWGNLRVECRIVEQTKKSVTVEAACWDIEKNSAIKEQKTRKIYGKKLKDGTMLPPDEDMINLATNAALSVALRNAIFRIVPRVYVIAAMEEAKIIALGKGKSLKDRRNDCVEYSKLMGISVERLVAACEGAKGMEDIGEDELIFLRGLFTSVKEGMAIEEAFPEIEPEKDERDDKGTTTKAAKEALKQKMKEKVEEEAAPKSFPDATTPEPEAVEPEKEERAEAEPAPEKASEGEPGNPEGDSKVPSWYSTWVKQLDAMEKEGKWPKAFTDLAGLYELNVGDDSESYSVELLDRCMVKLESILKSRSQAAIVVGTVEKCKLPEDLKQRYLTIARSAQEKLATT